MSGRVVKTARRAKKSAAGYDLTRLFVGSEGTLGEALLTPTRIYVRPALAAFIRWLRREAPGAADALSLVGRT